MMMDASNDLASYYNCLSRLKVNFIPYDLDVYVTEFYMAVLNSAVRSHCCIFPAKASEENIFLGEYFHILFGRTKKILLILFNIKN